MQLHQSNSDNSKSGSIQTGESQRQKDQTTGVQREGLLSLRARLPYRVTVMMPFRNEADDYVPVVDVLSVLTERGFESRVQLAEMHVNTVNEHVYLGVHIGAHWEGQPPGWYTPELVLHRRPVHSIHDDRVSYQCFYGLALADSPDVAVYWLGVGMRLRNGKTRHFPADPLLDGNMEAQFQVMCQQDPGN
jgi:hypothetical protein